MRRALGDDDVDDIVDKLYKARLRIPAAIAKVTVDDLVKHADIAPIVAPVLVNTAKEERGACFCTTWFAVDHHSPSLLCVARCCVLMSCVPLPLHVSTRRCSLTVGWTVG